jgi:hypothetical protein
MLHHGNDFGRHEPGGTDGCPGTCDLRDLDYSPGVSHLDPPAGPCGLDFEALDSGSHVDEDFHAVTLHWHQGSHRRRRRPGWPYASGKITL